MEQPYRRPKLEDLVARFRVVRLTCDKCHVEHDVQVDERDLQNIDEPISVAWVCEDCRNAASNVRI